MLQCIFRHQYRHGAAQCGINSLCYSELLEKQDGADLYEGRSSVKEGAEAEWSALAMHPETLVEEVQLLFWVPRKHRLSMPFLSSKKSKVTF